MLHLRCLTGFQIHLCIICQVHQLISVFINARCQKLILAPCQTSINNITSPLPFCRILVQIIVELLASAKVTLSWYHYIYMYRFHIRSCGEDLWSWEDHQLQKTHCIILLYPRLSLLDYLQQVIYLFIYFFNIFMVVDRTINRSTDLIIDNHYSQNTIWYTLTLLIYV